MLLLDTDSGDVLWNDSLMSRVGASEALVLSAFIKSPGVLILKDDLLDIGWPDKFVAPNSLAVAIKNLRRILQLTASDKLFIETVHRKGYIFHCNGITCESIQGARKNEPLPKIENFEPEQELNLNGKKAAGKSKNEGADSTLLIFLSVFRRMSFYMAFSFFTILAVLIHGSKKNVECYHINNASLCGLFILDEESKKVIKSKVGEQNGEYVYGYEKKLSDIEIYKMD
ncbi:winged helix-turn-helix domain-containing protein [Aeromonas rivipollensis]|uniref:OmpR/PhoB-type domain-containing protein n=1 Tax=Aeromonas rivipollensis TaxID=948519 RepID=A0AAW9Y735_9GAMM|nr:winged helix-turn-helix domain-containing protein [Aeromonas rivipollensis]NEX73589.1 hypothetical protein [Aeromonas rivipollensis]